MQSSTPSQHRIPAFAWWRVTAIIVAVVVTGCASQRPAPVEDRSATPARRGVPAAAAHAAPAPPAAAETESRAAAYIVKRGDTLFQIALDTGLDYRELAAWNNIENVNLIRVGQVLRLSAPGEPVAGAAGVVTAPLKSVPAVVEAKPGAPSPAQAAPAARNTENYKSSPKALKEPYSEQALRDVTRLAQAPPEPVVPAAPTTIATPKPEPKPEPPRAANGDGGDDDRLDWVWPAKGRVVGSFSESANLKGIDIAGAAGQPVFASAAGAVVYAGTGLRGYGKLIIVKHNKTYLSAYAHNREILVKEGQKVSKGQKIAEMGSTDATEVKLHFEIRRLGKPMDPTRYLPPA
ncbi:MAG: peptidoglycan DD-metalloendopeptidase family protein [Burkholderiales bacterium]|nr:peptidoglycan DD-metalloendopeptidase family protein [Burkholderiales bacterium]